MLFRGEALHHRVRATLVGLALAGVAISASASCLSADAEATMDAIVERVEAERLEYVFVGERHDVGPVKRFAVDLVNRLVERGHDVGFYVEGFRTDCAPRDPACRGIAQLFNADAFASLLERSLAPVRPLDPPVNDRRPERMATTIAGAREAVRVVLVGNSHVVHAGDPEAELWVYGGGMRYPNPGDLVEAFRNDRTLTVALEPGELADAAYALRADGCRADYRLIAPYQRTY